MHKIPLTYPTAKVQLFLLIQKKVVPLHHQLREHTTRITLTINGEVPEWSIGAVSKTVDQLAGPRVRIPASPQKKTVSLDTVFFILSPPRSLPFSDNINI